LFPIKAWWSAPCAYSLTSYQLLGRAIVSSVIEERRRTDRERDGQAKRFEHVYVHLYRYIYIYKCTWQRPINVQTRLKSRGRDTIQKIITPVCTYVFVEVFYCVCGWWAPARARDAGVFSSGLQFRERKKQIVLSDARVVQTSGTPGGGNSRPGGGKHQ